jgi:hypothetical protein
MECLAFSFPSDFAEAFTSTEMNWHYVFVPEFPVSLPLRTERGLRPSMSQHAFPNKRSQQSVESADSTDMTAIVAKFHLPRRHKYQKIYEI